MFDHTLGLSILISILGYFPGIDTLAFESRLFPCLVILLFSVANLYNPARKVNDMDTLVWLNLLMLFNVFTHDFLPWTVNYAKDVFFLSAVVFIVIKRCRNIDVIKNWIVFAYILNCFVVIPQALGYDFILPSLGYSSGGMMGNVARLSFLSCIVLPLAFSRETIKIWLIALVFCVSLIVKPQISVFLTVLVCFWAVYRFSFKYVLLICALGLGLVIYFKPYSIYLRVVEYYIPTIQDFFTFHFWTGAGFGYPLFERKVGADFQIYSSFLMFIVSSGIFGLIWLVLAVKKFFKYFTITGLNLSVLSVILLCLFEYPFEVKRLWFLIASVIGLCVVENIQNKEINRFLEERDFYGFE